MMTGKQWLRSASRSATRNEETEMKQIDAAILQTRVEGINLRPGAFADQIGDGVVLLNFLRHLG